MVRRALALVAATTVACQGSGSNNSANGSNGSNGSAGSNRPEVHDAAIADASVPDDAEVADGARPEEPEPPDPGKVIDDLGAISAWQAVVDRWRLLGRRHQRGVVYGRVGPAILMPAPTSGSGFGSGSAIVRDAGPPADAALIASPYTWLVDDSEGEGWLGIRIALGGRTSRAGAQRQGGPQKRSPTPMTATEGDRVAIGGAWQLDDQRRWYWKADWVKPIPKRPAPAPAPASRFPVPTVPTHELATSGLIPGARPITLAKEGDIAYFQLVGRAPTTEGDGWPVANQLGDRVYAYLVFPGERPSYGAQDMRTPDERWSLRRARTYAVQVGRIRTRDPDEPVVIRARSAPVWIK